MAEYDNTNRGSLWAKKTKDDKKYLGGTVNVGGTEFFISVFKNDNKKSESSPDYSISIMEKTAQEKPAARRATTAEAPAPRRPAPQKPAAAPARRPAPEPEDDEGAYEDEVPAPRRSAPQKAVRRPAPPVDEMEDDDVPF